MKTKKNFLLWAVMAVGFACIACEEEENYYDVTYYGAVGEGYVFMYDNDTNGNVMYPVQGAEILVQTCLEGPGGLFGALSTGPDATYTTDKTGKYQVRFIKRTQRRNAWRYLFSMTYYEGGSVGWCRGLTILTDEIKDAKNTIILDTVKLYKNEIQ